MDGCPRPAADGTTIPDETRTLLFSGHLTNREELAEALGPSVAERLGDHPGRALDHAYARAILERWGRDGVARLNGTFALAYWEATPRRLVLAVDIMGFRPLYYHHDGNGLVFATALPSLLAWPGVPTTIDEGRLIDDLLMPRGVGDTSHYAAIRRVPAATVLTFSDGEIAAETYWRPETGRRLAFRRDDDYVEAAREVLERAVRPHLRSDEPMVCQISGGLDSSAVATTTARLLAPATVATVTAIPEAGVLPPVWNRHGFVDERSHVEAIAAMHRNLQPHFLLGTPAHPLEADPTLPFRLTGAPRPNLLNNIWFMPAYNQVRALGARTVLSGFLGNLTLSWGGREALGGLACTRPWRQRLRDVRGYSRMTAAPLRSLLWRWWLRPGLPAAAEAILDRARLRPRVAAALAMSPLNPSLLKGRDIAAHITSQHATMREGGDAVRRRLFQGLQQVSDTQAQGDVLFGVERRYPFADRRLIEFCFAVPDDQYLRDGVTRFLARRALADRLPATVTGNPRYGVQSPDSSQRLHRQRNVIAAGMAELERSPLARHVLDLPRLRALITAWPDDPARLGPEYHMVLYRGLHYGHFLRWVESGCPR